MGKVDINKLDYDTIVREAWAEYDPTRTISKVTDISAAVSTNHVYKVTFKDRPFAIAKLSHYGNYRDFREDHAIINVLSNNLAYPFENFLSRALLKGTRLFLHRFQAGDLDTWVIFYRPVRIRRKPPKRFNEDQIIKFAYQFAKFHKSCDAVRHTLPTSTKTMTDDIERLILKNYNKKSTESKEIMNQCNLFLEGHQNYGNDLMPKIPVFIDWNIGNFSVTSNFSFYSRWDYDWFRFSTRMLDFYFISRVVSDVGDKSVFSYLIDPMLHDRFLLFLKHYHKIFPLKESEIYFLKEAYRFFILNYVIKDGDYFFNATFANKLREEAFELYFKEIDQKFSAKPLLDCLI